MNALKLSVKALHSADERDSPQMTSSEPHQQRNLIVFVKECP